MSSKNPLKCRKIVWITVASLSNFDKKQLLWRNIMLSFMFQNIYKMLQKWYFLLLLSGSQQTIYLHNVHFSYWKVWELEIDFPVRYLKKIPPLLANAQLARWYNIYTFFSNFTFLIILHNFPYIQPAMTENRISDVNIIRRRIDHSS